MATVLYARLSGKFMGIKSKLWRKKLHRKNQDSNYLGSSFSTRGNPGTLIQFKRQFQQLKV